jgi:hypothetical protein
MRLPRNEHSENLTHFYTKMWIKLLPMSIHVDSTKNVVYKTYHEVSVALADHGISCIFARSENCPLFRQLIIPGDGDPFPRCGQPMQIREYDGVDEELPSQPFFTRWFCCMNKACKTTLVMPARYKVV